MNQALIDYGCEKLKAKISERADMIVFGSSDMEYIQHIANKPLLFEVYIHKTLERLDTTTEILLFGAKLLCALGDIDEYTMYDLLARYCACGREEDELLL